MYFFIVSRIFEFIAIFMLTCSVKLQFFTFGIEIVFTQEISNISYYEN